MSHMYVSVLPGQPYVTYQTVAWLPYYQIGSDGSVWSCFRCAGKGRGYQPSSSWRKLVGKIDAAGYRLMLVQSETGRVYIHAHRLVLEAFVGPAPVGQEASHENGVRADNRLENLRWDTPKGNAADKILHGTALRGEKVVGHKLTSEQVLEIRARKTAGEGQKALAEVFGVSTALINAVWKRRAWCHVD